MLIALLTAVLIDGLLGDVNSSFHPVVLMGSFINRLRQAWNCGSPKQRLFAGFALIFLGGLLFSVPWLAFHWLLRNLPVWLQGLLAGLALKPCFAFNALIKASREVQQALQAEDLKEARRLLNWHLVSRHTQALSAGQVASGTIESLSENLTDSFLAPLLCFAIGGLPLAWLYRFVNTADAMIAYHTPELEYFGKVTARADDALNWIPARIAGMLLVLAAGLVALDWRNAWRVLLAQHKRTSSPNAGWTMAAAAGALNVVLEKTSNYRLEGGSAFPETRHISAAIRLLRVAYLLSLILTGGLLVLIKPLF
ncbi:MAG: adenosylcobinamide-phosphate synthase CbiB [Anaerolineaceae bacterium]|nr:adenosylcobinamide-phosphate synthase CbiB [Anaerolineaceae bacterium]